MNKKISIIVFGILMIMQIKVFAVYPVVVEIIDPSNAGVKGYVNAHVSVYYQRTVRDSLHIIRGRIYDTKGSGEYRPGERKYILLPTTNYQIAIGVKDYIRQNTRCYYFQPKFKWGGKIELGRVKNDDDTESRVFPKASRIDFKIDTPILDEDFDLSRCLFDPYLQ